MDALTEFSAAARTVFGRLGEAVVSIGRDGRGSGVVVAPGKVLTNAHNLQDRTTQIAFADGRAEQGTLSASDPDGDLVVLDVDTGTTAAIVWAEAAPEAGDVVFSVSRGGHRARVSFGMISSVDVGFQGPRGREITGGVEHTATMARGASGSPLADAQGRVLGINTHRSGRGFYVARPSDAALRTTVDNLVAGTSVTRPRLGVALAPPEVAAKLRASVGLPPREGLLVRGVEDDAPAAKAGIAAGDLLVQADNTPLTSIEALASALASGNGTVSLTVLRGTEERAVTVAYGAS